MAFWKSFSYIAVMTGFILLFTYAVPLGWSFVSGEEAEFEKKTTIGGISIAGLDEKEAKRKLSKHVKTWKSENEVVLVTLEGNIIFDRGFLVVDWDQTFDQVDQGTSNTFSVEAVGQYKQEVEGLLDHEVFARFDWEGWITDLEKATAELTEELDPYFVYDYIPNGERDLYQTIASYHIEVAEMNLNDLVESMNLITIGPNSSFSLLSHSKDKLVKVNQETLSAVATVIYGAILKTNFHIKERHISHRLPAYAELGTEASVMPKQGDDLAFYNPNQSEYEITLALEGKQLTASVKGYPLANDFEVLVDQKETIPPRTILAYTTFINPGETEVMRKGEHGISAVVYRITRGKESVEQKIAYDYYPPVDRIELRYGTEAEDSEKIVEDNNSGSPANGDSSDLDKKTPVDAPAVTPSDSIWEEETATK